MSTSNQLSNTFLGYLNLDMSNPSYPPFPDLHDYITSLPFGFLHSSYDAYSSIFPAGLTTYFYTGSPNRSGSPISSYLFTTSCPILHPWPERGPTSVLRRLHIYLRPQKACWTFYWQSRDKKQYTPACTGRLYTLEKESVKRSSDHNHPPSDREVMKSTTMSKAKYDTSTTTSSNVARAVLDSNPADVKAILPPSRLIAKQNRNYRKNNASEGATMRSNTQQLRTILASGPLCHIE